MALSCPFLLLREVLLSAVLLSLVSSDSVESLLLAKAISYFQELLHLNRCVATAFRIILRASRNKVVLSNSYGKSMGVDLEREMKIY